MLPATQSSNAAISMGGVSASAVALEKAQMQLQFEREQERTALREAQADNHHYQGGEKQSLDRMLL